MSSRLKKRTSLIDIFIFQDILCLIEYHESDDRDDHRSSKLLIEMNQSWILGCNSQGTKRKYTGYRDLAMNSHLEGPNL